jgi:methionyl-tRNA formyltransferase
MLLAESLDIAPNDTTGTLHDRLAELGGQLIVDALQRAGHGTLTATSQPAEGVNYAHKIDKAEAVIDWTQDANLVARRIRAFNPAPGAVSWLHGESVKLWLALAAPLPTASAPPGTVIDASPDGITVACGTGAVVLGELQRAGGKRLTAARFLQGCGVLLGERFGPPPKGVSA